MVLTRPSGRTDRSRHPSTRGGPRRISPPGPCGRGAATPQVTLRFDRSTARQQGQAEVHDARRVARRLPHRLAQEFDRIADASRLIGRESREIDHLEVLRRRHPRLPVECFSLRQPARAMMRERGSQQRL